jgi:hypothetical protein
LYGYRVFERLHLCSERRLHATGLRHAGRILRRLLHVAKRTAKSLGSRMQSWAVWVARKPRCRQRGL